MQQTVVGMLSNLCPGVYITCGQPQKRWKHRGWLLIFFYQSRCYFSQCLVTVRCVYVNMFFFYFETVIKTNPSRRKLDA